MKKSELRQIIKEEIQALNESSGGEIQIFKAKDSNWYAYVTDDDDDEMPYDATAYGPFPNVESAETFLRKNLSNRGGSTVVKGGARTAPKKSPDGSRLINPK